MELHLKARDDALKSLRAADHMFSITLPMLKDTKLLMAVIDNIARSLEHTMSALLYYERLHKRIPPFEHSFESKFNMLRMKRTVLHKLPKEHIELVQTINEIRIQHEKSPVEFIRNDRFVICSTNYTMRTITTETIQNYIKQSKQFFTFVDRIIS